MVRTLISAALHLGANAIGLLVAALVLDDMSIDASAFVFAVVIFTVVEVIAQPLIQKIAIKNVHALVGSVALITTFVGLVVTDLISDGLSITGVVDVGPGHHHRVARRHARRPDPPCPVRQEDRPAANAH